jgi:hypothetical protein
LPKYNLKHINMASVTPKHPKHIEEPIGRLIAALNWEGHATDKLKKAKAILQKLTGNPKFPTPYPIIIIPLSKLSSDITAYDTAITTASLKGKGTASIANTAGDEVHDDLKNLMIMVQIAMDNDETNARTTCEGAGYVCKAESLRGKRTTKATPGHMPGMVLLEGEGLRMHQWQQSPDGGKTIVNIDPTTSGKKTVTGLTSDVREWFRGRQVLPDEQYGPWSAWVSVMVP